MQRATSEVLLVGVAGCAAGFIWAMRSIEVDQDDPVDIVSGGPYGDGLGKMTLVQWVVPACFGAWLVAESMLHPVSVATSSILHCWLSEDLSAAGAHVPKPLRSLLELQGDDDAFVEHYA
mmetsp:Transcript_53806/g.141066  ORF Transcript_53806/g.141066 Transcript_53806/m.141066 type:complete len:120 (+) Transcript_53806:2-361(+)